MLQSAGGLAGAVVGAAASRFFGFALLFPAVFGLLAVLLLVKLGPKRLRPFVPAASVLLGHVGWMIVGALALGSFRTVGIDIILMAALAGWLLAWPGLPPVAAIAVFELGTTAVNVAQLRSGAAAGMEKALLLHLLLRLGTMVALGFGYRAWRRVAQSAASSTEMGPAGAAD